jgi:hypothetical protein
MIGFQYDLIRLEVANGLGVSLQLVLEDLDRTKWLILRE